MEKKYFLCIIGCAILILGGIGLSYANNACLVNEEIIGSSLNDLNEIVNRVDMDNFLPDETIMSEDKSSHADDQAGESELCKETQEIAQPSAEEQAPPAVLAENKEADNSNPFNFLEDFSFIKEIHSSIVELASK